MQELLDDTRDLYWIQPDSAAPSHAVLSALSAKAGIAWSSDGQRLATVAALDSGAVTVIDTRGGKTRYPIVPGGEVRDIAWAAHGDLLALSIKPAGRSHFQLAQLALKTGAVRMITPPDSGDAAAPLFLPRGKGIVYRWLVGASKLTVACDIKVENCRTLGPSNGQIVPWGLHPTGDSVYLSQLLPRAIFAANVHGGVAVPAYGPIEESRPRDGRRIDVASFDGLRIPLYVRLAPRLKRKRPVLFMQVMGALGKESPPPWDSKTDYLYKAGVDVMKVHYRGKAGFGPALLNAPGGESARVQDVLAAWNYAVDSLRIDPSHIMLFGHSDGGMLAIMAALQNPSIKNLALSSVLRVSKSLEHPPKRIRCVIAFQGDLDPLPSDLARRQIEMLLGKGSIDEPCGHFQVLPREAHEIERAESWAEVYAAITGVLRRRD